MLVGRSAKLEAKRTYLCLIWVCTQLPGQQDLWPLEKLSVAMPVDSVPN